MDIRGWQGERTVPTLDPGGRTVPITTGILHNARGAWVAAIAIGVEGTATGVITRPLVDMLDTHMQATIHNAGRARVRTEWTRDTLGQAVPITCRRALDSRRQSVPILSIGGAAGAAVFSETIRQHLVDNMRFHLDAATQLNRVGA